MAQSFQSQQIKLHAGPLQSVYVQVPAVTVRTAPAFQIKECSAYRHQHQHSLVQRARVAVAHIKGTIKVLELDQ